MWPARRSEHAGKSESSIISDGWIVLSQKKKNTKPQQLITIMSVSGQIGPRRRTRETAIQMIQAAEMNFLQRVAGVSLGDGVRSSVIQEWLKVEEPVEVDFSA